MVHAYGFDILRNIQNLAKQQSLQGRLVFISCQSLPSGFHSQGWEHLGLAQGRASANFWNVMEHGHHHSRWAARPQGREEHAQCREKEGKSVPVRSIAPSSHEATRPRGGRNNSKAGQWRKDGEMRPHKENKLYVQNMPVQSHRRKRSAQLPSHHKR